MQALSTTALIKRYNPQYQQQQNDEQGFALEEAQSLIVPKHQPPEQLIMVKSEEKRSKAKYRQPKHKLTLLTKQKNSKEQLRKALLQKEERKNQGRSLQLSKKQSRQSMISNLLQQCVSKIKRTAVGQNISIPIFSLNDSKTIKAFIINQGSSIVYESPKQINTHGFLRSFGACLLKGDFNQLLKMKLRDSFIMPKKYPKLTRPLRAVEFNADCQSANLEYAAEIQPLHYDLYLKNDTNTHGHQAWFYFRVNSNLEEPLLANFNICNIKRDLKLFQEGEKVYVRKIAQNGEPMGVWEAKGDNIQFKVNHNNKFTFVKVYKLSFDLQLHPRQYYEVALLPSYSYTDMLRDVTQIQDKQNVNIDILTYSLVGLAIPIITITNSCENTTAKNIILISCRIHPGQTNASYMCRGLLHALTSNTQANKQFLQKNVVKIIPMLNPDGVVFGNFRTNFLGVDLNRAFDTDQQITNPQVIALKDLGLRLKQQYGDRFNLFLDLHGHSSQRNIFTYGPDYQTTETNFYQIRLLPKILNSKSKFFKYGSCSFKLEDYKRNTARGFFLNTVNVNAYTIESSYAVFTDQNKATFFGWQEWVKFGEELTEGIGMLYKLSRLSLIKNRSEIKKALSESDKDEIEIIKKFKKEFKKEKQQIQVKMEGKRNQNGQDSDGQNECQDYSRNQRQEVMRRVSQTVMPNMILPRVLRPSIVYPTVTPKLFKIREQFEITHLKILYTRRSSKYSGLRMHGNNYIHSLKGIDLMKPEKHIFI